MILILASFFRVWMSTTVSLYLNEYMKAYQEEYNIFSAQTSASAFLGGVISTTTSGIIVDYFGPKYEMTIPMLCIVKTIISIPEMFMIFDQQSNFTLSMAGIHLHNLTAQGWSSTAIFMLKTIVDPKVAYLGISFFMVLTSVTQVVASQSMALFIGIYDLDAVKTPAGFGRLLTLITVITMSLSVPFFYISGKRIVAKTRAEQQLRMSTRDRVLESKKASAFIRSTAGGDLLLVGEMKPNTFSELVTMKA